MTILALVNGLARFAPVVFVVFIGCSVCGGDLDEYCDDYTDCGPLTEQWTELDRNSNPTVFDCGRTLVLEMIDKDSTSYLYYREEDRSLVGAVYKGTGFCGTWTYGDVDRSLCRDSDCVCEDADVLFSAHP